MKRSEIQSLVDNLNMRLLLERSLVQLQPIQVTHSASFQITIPEDKYISSKIINVTDEFRDMIEEHFKKKECGIKWNNTGSTFRVIPPNKPI